MCAVGLYRRLSVFAVVTTFLLGVTIYPATAQVVFFTGFEYPGGEAGEPSVDFDAANLNGAIDQIGTFSGDLPFGDGNNASSNDPQFMGFGTHGGPNQNSRVMLGDRPLRDGSFFANLASTIPVDGARVSFELGTRRTNGDTAPAGSEREKDYEIIGWDSSGNESFHLYISAFSGDSMPGEAERLGVVSGAGSTIDFDLDTVQGDDADGDLPGDRHRRGNVAIIDMTLEDDGFFIDFENFRQDPDNNNADISNAYTTAKLPYNGPATELSKIEFTFAGGFEVAGAGDQSLDRNFQGGYALDNIRVALVPEPNSAVLALIAAVGTCARARRRTA